MLTHADIKTKFLIEYDKANVTSSYPSLTDYEIATILDRAYLALIARKMTGNNYRRSSFESDIKSIEDLRPLIVTKKFDVNRKAITKSSNEVVYDLPSDLLYYIESVVDVDNSGNKQITKLVSHEQANQFRNTSTNLPWIDNPVTFIDNGQIRLLYDTFLQQHYKDDELSPASLVGTYLKSPNKFAINSDDTSGSRPTTPEVETWTVLISNTTAGSLIQSTTNRYKFEGSATSSKGNTAPVYWSITLGSDYAFISSDGTMVILNSEDSDYHAVMVEAVCSKDSSVKQTIVVYVKYIQRVEPETWYVQITNRSDWVYNSDNSAQFAGIAMSNKGNVSDIYWHVVDGSEYASIGVNTGLLSVNPTVEDVFHTITIRATNRADSTTHEDLFVGVKYYTDVPSNQLFTLDLSMLDGADNIG